MPKNKELQKLIIDADNYFVRIDLEDDVKNYLQEFKAEEMVIEGKEEHLRKLGLSNETTIWTVKCVFKK